MNRVQENYFLLFPSDRASILMIIMSIKNNLLRVAFCAFLASSGETFGPTRCSKTAGVRFMSFCFSSSE